MSRIFQHSGAYNFLLGKYKVPYRFSFKAYGVPKGLERTSRISGILVFRIRIFLTYLPWRHILGLQKKVGAKIASQTRWRKGSNSCIELLSPLHSNPEPEA